MKYSDIRVGTKVVHATDPNDTIGEVVDVDPRRWVGGGDAYTSPCISVIWSDKEYPMFYSPAQLLDVEELRKNR